MPSTIGFHFSVCIYIGDYGRVNRCFVREHQRPDMLYTHSFTSPLKHGFSHILYHACMCLQRKTRVPVVIGLQGNRGVPVFGVHAGVLWELTGYTCTQMDACILQTVTFALRINTRMLSAVFSNKGKRTLHHEWRSKWSQHLKQLYSPTTSLCTTWFPVCVG